MYNIHVSNRNEFINLLEKFTKRSNLNRFQLSKLLGVKNTSVLAWFNREKGGYPSDIRIMEISQVLNLSKQEEELLFEAKGTLIAKRQGVRKLLHKTFGNLFEDDIVEIINDPKMLENIQLIKELPKSKRDIANEMFLTIIKGLL